MCVDWKTAKSVVLPAMQQSPWTLYTVILVIGMLVTGTLNTITKKIQNQAVAVGVDGSEHSFDHPWARPYSFHPPSPSPIATPLQSCAHCDEWRAAYWGFGAWRHLFPSFPARYQRSITCSLVWRCHFFAPGLPG